MGVGDQVAELGSLTGWPLLRLALETQVDRVMGVSASNHALIGGKVRDTVESLAPGRIPWHRRIEFVNVTALDEFVTDNTALRSATVVLVNGRAIGGVELDVLTALPWVLQGGTVVVTVGVESAGSTFCSFGLLPLLERAVDI